MNKLAQKFTSVSILIIISLFAIQKAMSMNDMINLYCPSAKEIDKKIDQLPEGAPISAISNIDIGGVKIPQDPSMSTPAARYKNLSFYAAALYYGGDGTSKPSNKRFIGCGYISNWGGIKQFLGFRKENYTFKSVGGTWSHKKDRGYYCYDQTNADMCPFTEG